MKTSVVPLTLLCCCLSASQILTEDGRSENAIIPEEVGNISEVETENRGTKLPKSGLTPTDVHNVLREMNVMLGELRVEQSYTQAELRALEERLGARETQVDELKRLNEAQAVELVELREISVITGNELLELQGENQDRRVVFSTSLLASGGGHTGPYNVHTTLVYRNVFTNIGDAYNPNTGFFTAPVRGVYQFNFKVYAHGSPGACAVLVKNMDHVVMVYEHAANHNVNSSNEVSLLLEEGDVVFVRLWAGYWIYDDGHHYSTFSGHLLFTLSR